MAHYQPTHKTSFLVMSDTHNFDISDIPAADRERYPMANPMPKVDVLLHCGDFTRVGGLGPYKKFLRLMRSFEAELKLVIAGNHDLDLDKEYVRSHIDMFDDLEEHDEAVAIMTGSDAKAARVTYLTEGTHRFTLKNGTSFSIFASPHQPAFMDWAFMYDPSSNHFGHAKIPAGVDIVMTHGPPAGCLDYIPHQKQSAGCASLLSAVQIARPKMHCFGHIHEGYGHRVQEWESEGAVDKVASTTITVVGLPWAWSTPTSKQLKVGKETLMVNAAVRDGQDRPVNAPWLVELELNGR